MAVQIQVAGKATVRVDTGDGSGLQALGVTINGVQITEEVFIGDVHGDLHGGDEGPVIDRQYFGEVHKIRCEFSRYDQDVAARVARRVAGTTTSGTVAEANIGDLYIQEGKTMRVVIDTANDTQERNYPLCIPDEPVELNKGTKFTTLVMNFEGHRNQTSGLLYDRTSS